MIELAVSQPCLTSGSSNECFTRESGETAWGDTARQQGKRQFKEKLPQFIVPAVFLYWPPFAATKTKVTMGRFSGARQSRWSGFVMRFQNSLRTARFAGERIINPLVVDVNLVFLLRLLRNAVLTSRKIIRTCDGPGFHNSPSSGITN